MPQSEKIPQLKPCGVNARRIGDNSAISPFEITSDLFVLGKGIKSSAEKEFSSKEEVTTEPSSEEYFDQDPPVRKRRVKKMS